MPEHAHADPEDEIAVDHSSAEAADSRFPRWQHLRRADLRRADQHRVHPLTRSGSVPVQLRLVLS